MKNTGEPNCLRPRYLQAMVKKDLLDRMVFVGGPRQVGKTTFALSFLKGGTERSPAYLNWDYPSDREDLLAARLPANQPLVILDEIHR